MRWFDQWDSNKKRDRKKGDDVTARMAEDAYRHEDKYTRAADQAAINDLMAAYLMQDDE